MLIQDELIAISADVVLTTWIPIAQGLKPAQKGENLSKKNTFHNHLRLFKDKVIGKIFQNSAFVAIGNLL